MLKRIFNLQKGFPFRETYSKMIANRVIEDRFPSRPTERGVRGERERTVARYCSCNNRFDNDVLNE